MPLTPEKLLSAVRVLDSGGVLLGTGFIVAVPSEVLDVRYGYLVTAHHVVEDDPEIYLQATDPYAFREGRSALYEPVQVKGWCQPFTEVDLVVAPVPWRTEMPGAQAWAVVRSDIDLLPTEVFPRELHPHLGGPIYYVGQFTPLDRAIARSGTIAALDQTDIPLGEERPKGSGDHPYSYPTHLIDCRSYDGFSGSPCFTTITLPGLSPQAPPVPPADGQELPPLGRMAYLSLCCGMFTEHYDQDKPNRAVSRLGVGFMVRSDEIKAALMTPKRVQERQEWDRENVRIKREKEQNAEDKPTPASAKQDEPGEFERFKDLTRKLVNTPKPKAGD